MQCSQCKAVFAVQVQPSALTPSGAQVPTKRSRKRKKESAPVYSIGGMDGEPSHPPRALSAYNVFMKGEVARVKLEHPSLPHREAFKMAAERWQASPMNPQNGGDRFPLKPGTGAKMKPEGAGEAQADEADTVEHEQCGEGGRAFIQS